MARHQRRHALRPGSRCNSSHLGVFVGQVIARAEDMPVIRGGQHYVILKDASGLPYLDGTRFQDFDFVDDDFLGESHV